MEQVFQNKFEWISKPITDMLNAIASKLGWITTVFLHGSLVFAAIVSFSNIKERDIDEINPVIVEIVSAASLEQVDTKTKQDLTVKKAIIEPVKKPIKKPVVEKPKPKPEPIVKPEPVVKPKPKPVAKDTPKPTPQPQPQPKPVEEAKTIEKLVEQITAPKLKENSFVQVATAPKPSKRPAYPKAKPVELPKKSEAPAKTVALLDKSLVKPEPELDLEIDDLLDGALDGDFIEDIAVASLSQFEFNAVRARMAACWSIPAGAQDAGNVVVKVGFNLNRNAEVVGQPYLLNSQNHPAFKIMAEAAIRAIIECGPYDMLPPEKYDIWNEFSMEFDPRNMF